MIKIGKMTIEQLCPITQRHRESRQKHAPPERSKRSAAEVTVRVTARAPTLRSAPLGVTSLQAAIHQHLQELLHFTPGYLSSSQGGATATKRQKHNAAEEKTQQPPAPPVP